MAQDKNKTDNKWHNFDFDSPYLTGKTDVEKVFEYHNRTKHGPPINQGYAKSAGQMDWANEPRPMRTYFEPEDANKFPFSRDTPDPENNYIDIYSGATSNEVKPFSMTSIGKFMELSLGLAAWKNYGKVTWALRINPSSGNLHPTESYLILPNIENTGSGVFHYNAYGHELEKRATLPDNLLSPDKGFYVALSSIHWREAWKYGERAFRYCNHDVGHAIACLSFSASLMGWQVKALDLTTEAMEQVLGFDKTDWVEGEEEECDIILYVCPNSECSEEISGKINSFKELIYNGEPNTLSDEIVDWRVIGDIAEATVNKTGTIEGGVNYIKDDFLKTDYDRKAASIIRTRRSAQSFDGETYLSKEELVAILDKTRPREGRAPFVKGLSNSYIDLLLFVHRVDRHRVYGGLKNGLYFYHRSINKIEDIKLKYNKSFLWDEVEPNLYLLEEGDFTNPAAIVSCNQAIAGDSAFSLGMVARFEDVVTKNPSMYKGLFWEAGMIGQVLYLEAEAFGIRGTGIGCYFDDVVHEKIIGLSEADMSYQSLYHFTIGGPVEDARLTTLPPYYHLDIEDSDEGSGS